MEVDELADTQPNAAGDRMVNSNNSEAQCSCECTVTPMDTSDAIPKTRKPRRTNTKVKRKRKVVKRAVRRKPTKRQRKRSRSFFVISAIPCLREKALNSLILLSYAVCWSGHCAWVAFCLCESKKRGKTIASQKSSMIFSGFFSVYDSFETYFTYF